MDSRPAIDRNLSALVLIVGRLFAMAGFAGDDLPASIARGERTVPRRLYRAMLLILRPAEAAARRLIIAMAWGLKVKLPKPRPPGETMPSPVIGRSRTTNGAWVSSTTQVASPRQPRLPRFRLFDPPRQPFRPRRVKPSCVPRIRSFFDDGPYRPQPPTPPPPPKPRPDDPIDATHLVGRLTALGHALDDMPKQALRFARWRARQQQGLTRRAWPLRRGPLPGGRLHEFNPDAKRRKNIREIDEVLAHANELAWYALKHPDTS